jgi:hypothetical protein
MAGRPSTDQAFLKAQYLVPCDVSGTLNKQTCRGAALLHALVGLALDKLVDALLEKLVEGVSVRLEVKVGHRVSARGADLVDVDEYNGPGSGDGLDVVLLDKVVEGGSRVLEDATVAKQAEDARRAFKGIEHDGDAAVAGLVEMRDGLTPGSREVHVPKGLVVHEAEIESTFGRDVHMSRLGEGSRRNPKDVLLQSPGSDEARDGLEELAHGRLGYCCIPTSCGEGGSCRVLSLGACPGSLPVPSSGGRRSEMFGPITEAEIACQIHCYPASIPTPTV